MVRRLLAVLALLALPAGAQEQPAPVQDHPLYRSALRSLEGLQPGIAAQRLNELLATLPDDDPGRPAVLVRMGEALVRADEPDKALEVLSSPAVASLDEAIFWSAAALAESGRLKDAADALARITGEQDPDLRLRALLNRARILASLGNSGEAREVLGALLKEDRPGFTQRARLLEASLLLEGNQLDAAAETLEALDSDDPAVRKRALFLRARLAAAAGDPDAAHRRFQTLIEDPAQLTPPLLRSITLGDADALHGLGRTAEAVTLLLSYAESDPGNTFLEPVFARLMTWSEGDSALRAQLRTRFAKWAGTSPSPEENLLRALGVPTASEQVADPGQARTNLGAHARYHHALLLAEENEPSAVARARALLHRLRLEYPTHPLAERSLLETARLFLADQAPEQALHALRSLSAVASSPALRSRAAELTARVEFAQGDFAEAAGAFARAREDLQVDDRYFTAINHGLSLLEAGDDAAFEDLLATLDDTEAARSLALERALVLASKGDPRAAPLLDLYLRRHPGSPRIVEARLALAETSLLPETRDLAMADAQLDSIETSQLSQPFALRHLLARLRLADLTGSWDIAIAEASDYIRTHQTPEEPAVLLKLGEAYYQNGDFNDARIQFLQAARKEEAPELREVARFYAAKAALRIGTTGARDDAIALFAEVADSDSPLAHDARLQLARAHLDAAKPEEALQSLAPLLGDGGEGEPPNIDALILSAEAHRLRSRTGDLARCLEIYDRILDTGDLGPALRNRIQFLKGLTYEQLRDPARAFEAYYEVINPATLGEGEAITEWKWYYDCGFSALRLLEEGKRWRAAYGVARTLAESGGPRAEEALRRAQKLQLDHMIWDPQ